LKVQFVATFRSCERKTQWVFLKGDFTKYLLLKIWLSPKCLVRILGNFVCGAPSPELQDYSKSRVTGLFQVQSYKTTQSQKLQDYSKSRVIGLFQIQSYRTTPSPELQDYSKSRVTGLLQVQSYRTTRSLQVQSYRTTPSPELQD